MAEEKIDLLNREGFIENVLKLVRQLSDNKRGCCFAIEGNWGVGKTFVIEKVEEKLKEEVSEATFRDRYFVFHYNCWQHDYYDEPAVAIISAMLSSIREDNSIIDSQTDEMVKAGWRLAKAKLKEIVGIYVENKIGINLVDVIDDIKANASEVHDAEVEFDKMFNFSQTIEDVRKALQEIAEDRTIVLVVDELDRCIPKYAIKVLERLHHIFYGLKNVVVIMAIDRTQLEHSVEEMFGMRSDDNSMDIDRYLKKFIDFSIRLDNGVVNDGFREKYKFFFDKFTIDEGMQGGEKLNEIVQILFRGIDIRRQEKLVEKINIAHSLITDEYMDISVLVFELMYEALILSGIVNMRDVAFINDLSSINAIDRVGIGKEKHEFLQALEREAYKGHVQLINGKTKKKLRPNLCGRIFWYFANIFNTKDNPYTNKDLNEWSYEKELEVLKKYCEFSRIIK